MSTELKKGDLVFHPKHKLCWVIELVDTMWYLPVGMPNIWLNIQPLDNLSSPATREQVGFYLKENGWVLSHVIKNNSNIYKLFKYKDYWTAGILVLDKEHFDTAPAQLAEAILMARLLNATKP